MFNPIEEVKNRLDIVEVIGGYIKLQKAGVNYRALCPFHSEKRPSFFVSPSRQMWHCFGSCSEGGDVFKFVMKVEGIEFGDALRMLAQKAGVELKKQDAQSAKWRTERQRLYEICELASYFFEKQLEASKAGQSAKKYLLDRGISKESIEKWRLGYAPDVWQGLSDFLVSKGYEREEIVKAGLAVKKEENESFKSFDRFRGRIMFPIFDLSGQIVGFTGRIFANHPAHRQDEVAKYVNTPATLLYDKSRVLYGLDKAKMAIRKNDGCILVEGQTDVIMSHQTGVENVVATSGTALTSYQLAILKRYSENLITAFDMDMAGNSATKRGIDLAQNQGFNIKVAMMPKDSDPADIVSKNPKEWQDIIDKAKTILDFYFDTAFSNHNADTAEGKKEISKALMPALKRIPNRIEQAHWIQKLAQKLGVKEEDIEIEMKKLRPEKDFPVQSAVVNKKEQENNSKSRGKLLEERIISLVLREPKSISLVNEDFFSFCSPQTKEILTGLKQDPNFFKTGDIEPKLQGLLNRLCFTAETEKEGIEPKEEIQTCLCEIQAIETKNKLDKISQQIKKAEQEKNTEKISSLTKEFQKLSQKLNEE